MHATLTTKGQVTLPKALRDKLQLSAGDRIEFIVDEDNAARLVVKHASVTRLKGILPPPSQPVSLADMDTAIETGARGS